MVSGFGRQGNYARGGFYAEDEDLDEFEQQYYDEEYDDEDGMPSDDSELIREHQAH